MRRKLVRRSTASPGWVLAGIVLALTLMAVDDVGAQAVLTPGAADEGDPRAGLGNPALLPFTGTTFFAGYHAWQTGFLDQSLRTYAISYHSPYWARGAGVSAQYFRSSAFRQGSFDLLYGLALWPEFALGGKIGLVLRQLSEAGFSDYDAGDPVLAQRSAVAVSAGLGFTAFPSPRWAIGAYADRLNQPNLALGSNDQDPLPISLQGEIQYRVADIFPALRFLYADRRYQGGVQLLTRPFYGLSLSAGAMLGAELEEPTLTLGLRYLLTRPTSPTTYGMVYEQSPGSGPTREFSQGDREAGIVVYLDRVIPVVPPVAVQPIPAALLPIELAPQARYFAYLEADSLAVTQKRITRRIDPSLTRAELAGLTWEEVGYIDSVAGPPVHRPPETVPLSLKDVPSRLSGIVSDSWRDGMDILQGYLQSRVGVDRLRILVDEGSEPRGKVVAGILGDTSGVQVVQPIASWRNRRIGRAELPPIERWYELSDSSIQFHLYSLTPSPYRGRWRLTVVDSEDNLVWEKTGDGVIPRYVRWDWRDLRGNVIDSDHYTYFLSWRDQYGQPRESRRYQFFVRRRVYATDVVIQRGLGGVELPDREVQLHLRAPGARVPRHLKED